MLITDVITEITDSNFDEFVKNKELSLVQITAVWCGPCKVLTPIIEQLAVEYHISGSNIKIGKMNVDESRDKAVDLGITSVPTTLLYKNGNLVERTVGMIQKSKLKDLIEKHI